MRSFAAPFMMTVALALAVSLPQIAWAQSDDADVSVGTDCVGETLVIDGQDEARDTSNCDSIGDQKPSDTQDDDNGGHVEDHSDGESESALTGVDEAPESTAEADLEGALGPAPGYAASEGRSTEPDVPEDPISNLDSEDGSGNVPLDDGVKDNDSSDDGLEAVVAESAVPQNVAAAAPMPKYSAEDAKAASYKGTTSRGAYILFCGTARGKALQGVTAAKKSSRGTSIITYDAKGKAFKWKISFDSKGYAVIKNAKTGLVLTVKGGKAVAKALVVQGKNIGSRSQKWIIAEGKNGTSRIETALGLGFSLAVKGGSSKDGAIGILAKNASAKAQRWTLMKVKPKIRKSDKVASGWYTVKSKLGSAFALYVKGLKAEKGTPLVLKRGSANVGFAFKLQKVGSYYRVIAGVMTKGFASIDGVSLVPGSLVDLSTSKSKATLFSLQYDQTKQGYRFVNAATGLALSVKAGKAKNKAKIVGEHVGSGKNSQVFVLQKRPGLLLEGVYSVKTAMKGHRAISAYGLKATYTKYSRDFEQKWLVSAVPGKMNTYTLESLATGYRLTGNANKQAKVKKASKATSQQWKAIWTGHGFALKNVKTKKALSAASGKVVEGAKVLNKGSKDILAKSFAFKKVVAVESGTYTFLSARNTAFAADVGDWSKKNGAKVIIWDATGNANQQWVYNAKRHTLMNVHSGKYLTVKGGNALSGSQIVQNSYGLGRSQAWTISYEGGGKFVVRSGLGKSLVLTASGAEEYGVVTASTDAKTSLQRWRFTPAGYDTSYRGFHLIKSIVSNGHGSLNASYIVIHETANPGATAKNHRDYWNNDDTYAVHYTLDWTGDCYYCVPENRLCWQVGNGNPYVIGIELCHATNASQFNNVWKGGVQWAAWQLKKHGWGIDRLISHNECRTKWGGTDHTDPDDYFAKFGKTWSQFKAAVKAAL